MARPRLNGTTPKFTLRLDQTTRAELEKEAAAEHRSLGNHIKTILAEHVGYDGPLNDTKKNDNETSHMKKRAHITIDTQLYREAANYAEEILFTDFSGLVVRLLVEELGKRKLIQRLASPSDRILEELVRRVSTPPPADNGSADVSSPLESIERERRAALESDKRHGAGAKRPATGASDRGAKGRGRR